MRALHVEGTLVGRRAEEGGSDRRGLVALLAAALAVRLALAPFAGYFHDVQLYVNWGALLDGHFLDFYSAGARVVPQPNYPPLAVYAYGLLVWLYLGIAALAGAHPSLYMDQTQALNVLMKLPTIVAELALTAVVFAIARERLPRRAAYLTAAAVAFSPVVLLDGALWGQLDAAYTLGLVLALLATARGRGLAAGVWFGLALTVKPQPVVFAPLVLVSLWRWHGRRQALRALGGMAVAVVVVCLPYLLPPRLEVVYLWHDVSAIVAALPNTTLSAFNLWWLLGQQNAPFNQPILGPFSANVLGWAIYLLILVYVLAGVWLARAPGVLWLGAAVLATAFFAVTTLQHERYLYPAVVFFAVAAVYDRRLWRYYAFASLTTFLNMAVILIHPVVSSSGLEMPGLAAFLGAHPEIPVAIAALNVLLLALGLRHFDAAAGTVATAADGNGYGRTGKGGRVAMVALRGLMPGVRALSLALYTDVRMGVAAVPGLPSRGLRALRGRLERLRTWSRTREGLAFWALMAVALLIRLPMLPYRGFFDDVQALVTWGRFWDHHALHFYSEGANLNPQPDYPPLAMYLFGLLEGVYTLACHLVGKVPVQDVNYSHVLPAVFKAPILLADLALTAVIYAVARRLVARRWALLAAAAYALSPAILLGGVLWGQIDVFFVLGLVLALLATARGRGLAAGVWFGLAIMIKPQPLALAPLILVPLWRWHGRRQALRAVEGLVLTVVVICLPYLLPPRPELLAYQQDVVAWVHAVPYTSVSALNFWWLLGVAKLPESAPYLGPFSTSMLGWAMFLVVLAVATLGVWLDGSPGRLFEAAGLLTAAFFTVGTLQHERYLLPAVVFYLLAALSRPRNVAFYLATSAATLLNIVLVLIAPPFSDSRIPARFAIGRHYLEYHPKVFGAVAAADVLLFLVLLGAYVWPLVAGLRATRDDTSPGAGDPATEPSAVPSDGATGTTGPQPALA